MVVVSEYAAYSTCGRLEPGGGREVCRALPIRLPSPGRSSSDNLCSSTHYPGATAPGSTQAFDADVASRETHARDSNARGVIRCWLPLQSGEPAARSPSS